MLLFFPLSDIVLIQVRSLKLHKYNFCQYLHVHTSFYGLDWFLKVTGVQLYFSIFTVCWYMEFVLLKSQNLIT